MQMETLPSGTLLHGRYRVERALGSGGFGHVYLCVDLQTHTQYAIKEYLVTGASGKAQLEHEAQVLSHLHHPNLPAFLSAFDEHGRYYVVLGYIEGNDLTDYLRVVRQKNEVLPIARLMEWLLSICDAVAFLHGQRPPIIHRDIKPDNIRIMPNGTAILVDLGNAKTAADGARTLFFIRHQGTPGYAPLEQYPGGTGTDERSDVYALGGTLYFALTAHEPPSVSARNQALQQKQPDLPTLQDRLAQNPPENAQEPRQFRLGVSKPSKPVPRHSRHVAQLGTLPPELLRKLDAIIQRAMAMKPKDRYQSVMELSNELKIVLRALPASPAPATPNRPVDPHSTQPDLPMLYESLQNQKQAQSAAPAPSASATPAAPAPSAPAAPAQVAPPARMTPVNPPQTPGPAVIRCPNCKAELNRPAPYCPNCGKPLTLPNQPKSPAGSPDPNPRSGGPDASPDISGEETMLFSPRVSSQEPPAPGRRSTPPNAQTMARGATNAHSSTPRIVQPPVLPASSQSAPVVQTEQSASSASPNHQASASSRAAQAANNPSAQASAYTSIKPFIPSAAASTNGQIGTATSSSVPSQPGVRTESVARKLFISVAIVVVVLVIVMLLLVVFLHSEHILGSQNLFRHSLLLVHNELARHI